MSNFKSLYWLKCKEKGMSEEAFEKVWEDLHQKAKEQTKKAAEEQRAEVTKALERARSRE